MIGLSVRCYIPSFIEIGPTVLEKKILRDFIIYGHSGHLGYVIRIVSFNFSFLVLKNLHTKIKSKWPTGFRENPVIILICKPFTKFNK